MIKLKKMWGGRFRSRLLLTLITIVIIIYGCQKKELFSIPASKNEERFFNPPNNFNPQLQKVIDELQRQNQLTGFVENFSKQHGFPMWNKTISKISHKLQNYNMRSNDSLSLFDTVIYIPLTNQDNPNNINSFIEAKIDDSISLRLFIANDYKKLLSFEEQDQSMKGTANNFAYFIMKMQNELIGTRAFRIVDTNLMNIEKFANGKSRRIIEIEFPDKNLNNTGKAFYVYNSDTDCREQWDDNGGSPILVQCSCSGGPWSTDCAGSGGGGSGGSGGSDGSGGSGGSGDGNDNGWGWGWGDGGWDWDGGYDGNGGGGGGGNSGGGYGCKSIGYYIIDGKLYNPCGGEIHIPDQGDVNGGWEDPYAELTDAEKAEVEQFEFEPRFCS